MARRIDPSLSSQEVLVPEVHWTVWRNSHLILLTSHHPEMNRTGLRYRRQAVEEILVTDVLERLCNMRWYPILSVTLTYLGCTCANQSQRRTVGSRSRWDPSVLAYDHACSMRCKEKMKTYLDGVSLRVAKKYTCPFSRSASWWSISCKLRKGSSAVVP